MIGKPNRFNSLYGASKAAEAQNKMEEAKGFYKELLKLAGETDPNREQIIYAKSIVGGAEES